jgi:hypothetical protein
MPKANALTQSWRFFHYARKYLHRSTLYAIFGKRHARTIDLWCEDPNFSAKDDRAFDPIQGVRDLLAMLDDHGHVGIVRSCLVYLASGTSVDLDLKDSVQDLKGSIGEEILADYRAVAEMQSAIESGERPEEIDILKAAAIAEIERTYARYHKDYRDE